MAMGADGHGDGGISLDVSEVERAIAAVEGRLAARMPEAMEQVGDLVARSARAEHGYQDRTRTLTDSIGADPVQGDFAGGSLAVVVAANAPYGRPVEFGSKPHDIFAKPGGVLRFATISGWVATKHVHHPGTKAVGFLSEALGREMPMATSIFADTALNAFEDAGFAVGF